MTISYYCYQLFSNSCNAFGSTSLHFLNSEPINHTQYFMYLFELCDCCRANNCLCVDNTIPFLNLNTLLF